MFQNPHSYPIPTILKQNLLKGWRNGLKGKVVAGLAACTLQTKLQLPGPCDAIQSSVTSVQEFDALFWPLHTLHECHRQMPFQ